MQDITLEYVDCPLETRRHRTETDTHLSGENIDLVIVDDTLVDVSSGFG